MRVLVAGATGVIGRQLVPLLTAVGHEVVALTRPHTRDEGLTEAGVKCVRADALDRTALTKAVRHVEPDAVVNMMTAIPGKINARRLARDFEQTNRLRTEGTRNLLDAVQDVGIGRFISQGLAYAYEPGPGLANEDAPLWREPPAQFAPVLEALVELEKLTIEARGMVLRFGHLYGPGSAYAADGSFVSMVKRGKVPVVGNGAAVFSFTHAHDAATAVVAALDRGVPGILNVVDDHPARLDEWLPALAKTLQAPTPKRAPAALARLAVGAWGVAFMNDLRGADNARARLHLEWRPRYSSHTQGFAELSAGQRRVPTWSDPRSPRRR